MSPEVSQRQEYVTIIAPSIAEAMAQFRQRGLDRDGFAIAGKVGRHKFCLVGNGGSAEMFSGDGMIAATFSRLVAE